MACNFLSKYVIVMIAHSYRDLYSDIEAIVTVRNKQLSGKKQLVKLNFDRVGYAINCFIQRVADHIVNRICYKYYAYF